MERIKRTERKWKRSTHLFLRTMAITAICIVLLALGFLAAAYFTGALS